MTTFPFDPARPESLLYIGPDTPLEAIPSRPPADLVVDADPVAPNPARLVEPPDRATLASYIDRLGQQSYARVHSRLLEDEWPVIRLTAGDPETFAYELRRVSGSTIRVIGALPARRRR